MEELYKFFKEAGVYYIATMENDQPRVRPFGTINLYEGKLYIQTGKKKKISKQLEDNPKAEICAFKDGKWARISGELVNDDTVEAKKSMLDSYPELRSIYSETDDNTQVLYFKNATGVISSFTEPEKVFQF